LPNLQNKKTGDIALRFSKSKSLYNEPKQENSVKIQQVTQSPNKQNNLLPQNSTKNKTPRKFKRGALFFISTTQKRAECLWQVF